MTNVAIGQTIRYAYADGTMLEVRPEGYSQLTQAGWGGFGLVVLGRDEEGAFVASFMPQDGLPSDCYVENGEGVERGSHIEARG